MDKECAKVLAELQSSHTSVRYGALIMLRTALIKSKEALGQLVQGGCVDLLVRILRDAKSQTNSAKTTDIVLSILANLCLEEGVRDQVVSCDGISAIAEVVMASQQESIHNRGVRALANLAQHPPNCDVIFQLKVPAFVAKRLMETEDKECLSTFMRSIRIVGHCSDNVKKLVEESMAVSAVASILKKDSKKLIAKSLRILNEMSSLKCCAAFAEEVLAANVLEELVTLAEDTDRSLAFFALSVILRLMDHGNLRPPLGNAGAIDLLMQEMRRDDSPVNLVSVLNALCLCSRESVNRQKLHSADALELFISCLDIRKKTIESREKDFSILHDRLISSLVNFLYDDAWMSRLLELDLVNVLMSHLHRVCFFEIPAEDLDKEIGILALLAEKTKNVREVSLESKNDSPVDKSGEGQSLMVERDEDLMQKEDMDLSASTSQVAENEMENVPCDRRTSPDLTQVIEIKDDEDPVPNEKLDEEVNDIVSNSGKNQDSNPKPVFSINSPTYQLGQSSWSINDYSSGVTCKCFSSDNAGVNSSQPAVENQDQPPFSPFSGGVSYYSPAYSPSYSVGSSPKYSPNPYALSPYNRGQGLSQASPTWSLASSERLSPIDHSRLYPALFNGLSGNSPSSPSSNIQAPLSPLSISFPASPPQPSLGEEQEPRSPLFNSQMSLVSQSDRQDQNSGVSECSQETEGSTTPFALVREMSQQGNDAENYKFSVVPLSQEGLIYSASEEDDGEEEGEEESHNPEPYSETQRINDWSHMTINSYKDKNASQSPRPESTSSLTLLRQQDVLSLKRSFSSPSTSTDKNLENDALEPNSEKIGHSQKSAKKIKFDESCSRSVENVPEQNRMLEMKTGSEDLFDSSQTESMAVKSTVPKGRKDQLTSHPFFKDWWKQPSRSPSRFHHLSPNPSLSPMSRHGMSPLASPRPYRSPYHWSGAHQSSGDVHPMDSPSHSASLHSYGSTTPDSNNSDHLSFFRQNSHLENQIVTAASTSSAANTSNANSRSHERLKNILRTSESNIMILLSRVSIKSNPSQYLLQPDIFRSLLCYLSLAPNPLQRCFRLLHRVCSNSLCFQPLLLNQAPAFIVRHLLQESDGSFPSVLFCTDSENSQQRLINLDDIIPSSQNSDTTASQASEFSQRMEFEFGNDAYSRLMSKSTSGAVFRQHPSISLDSQSAQDSSSTHGGVVYENESQRKKLQIQLGMQLLRTLSSSALSRYGDGEVRHILARGSSQDKLQCVISLLHLLIACGPFSRHQLLSKASFEELLPFLFVPDARVARDAIVTAISLYAHINSVSKTVKPMSDFTPCPDIDDEMDAVEKGEKLDNVDLDGKPLNQLKMRKNGGKDNGAKGATQGNLKDHNASTSGTNSSDSDSNKKCFSLRIPSTLCNGSCFYSTLSSDFDMSLVIINEDSQQVFGAHKECIMRKSHYFASMLGGNYEEANKREITLKNVSIEGFGYVIHYLHGCTSGCSVIDSIPPEMSKEAVDDNSSGSDNRQATNEGAHAKASCTGNKGNNSAWKESSSAGPPSLNTSSHSLSDTPSPASNIIMDASSQNNINDLDTHKVSISHNSSVSDKLSQCLSIEDSASQSDLDTPLPSTSQTSPSLETAMTSSDAHQESQNPSASVERVPEDALYRKVDQVLDTIEDVLAVADQFVLTDLIRYLTSILSHQCLFPHTCEFVFGLACFYKLDDLVFDCVAHMLLSSIPRCQVSAFILKMGFSEYREQVERMLYRLTGPQPAASMSM